MTEEEGRARILAEARTWIRTPYHDNAMLKGIGVDCAMLLFAVVRDAGVLSPETVAPYRPQWFLHRSEEKFLAELEKYARYVDTPKPADVAVWKLGRSFAHGAFVVDPGWPAIIHADGEARMVVEARGDGGRLQDRPVKFLSLW